MQISLKAIRKARITQLTLRAVRISRGYTIEETADRCGVSVNTVKMYEFDSGTIPKRIALIIMKMFEVSLDMIHIGPEKEYFLLTEGKRYV